MEQSEQSAGVAYVLAVIVAYLAMGLLALGLAHLIA